MRIIKILFPYLLGVTLLFLGTVAQGQFTLVNTFSPGNVRYEDCWSIQITNPGIKQSVYAELEISKNSKPHLKAVSTAFFIEKGSTQLNFSNLSIEQIIVNTDNILWNQFLTFGEYMICIHIYSYEQGGSGEVCMPLSVLPVSPPQVISPEDGAEVEMYPLFSWIPPVPMNIYKNLGYALKIVPVYTGQLGYEAMSRNTPVLFEPMINALSFMYNVYNQPLNETQQYAWQITAIDNGAEVGKSDVRTFTTKPQGQKPQILLIPEYYYKLRKTDDGNFGTAKGCLGFTCEEERLDSNMQFTLYNAQHLPLTCNDNIALKRIGDENYFILELANCSLFKAAETYRLEVMAPSKNKYVLYFKYFEPETK